MVAGATRKAAPRTVRSAVLSPKGATGRRPEAVKKAIRVCAKRTHLPVIVAVDFGRHVSTGRDAHPRD